MEMRWNLDNLYTSFDSVEFKNDLAMIDKLIEETASWAEEKLNDKVNALEKITWWLEREVILGHTYSRLSSFAGLRFSVDASDSRARKYEEILEVKMSGLTKAQTLFIKWLPGVENLSGLIESSAYLQTHRFYLTELVEKSRYMLSDDVEVAMAKMKNTGSNSWSQLWNVLTSNHLVEIEIDGERKSLPLPVVRNMAYDKDARTRKKAYEAELDSYSKITESAAASLNGVKGEVITSCELRGYESPLEMTLKESRMDKATLDAMLGAMKKSLPSFRKYLKKKGELLGHKNGLPFFDLFAPMGESDMTFTYSEAREFIVKNFRNFSDELADFADSAFERNWIDAEPREGKRGGAFCANLHVIGESRVMSNFTGSFSDVTTLAHELGHANHGHCLRNETYINSDYPMPLAETASIFCETIVVNAALKEADEKQAFTILESSISDATQVIVDIYSRYLFETELFEKRKDSSLSVEEMQQAMINGQKGSYGDGLDPDWLHPYMWVCKPHYYYSDANFYNFPYAFGLLFAKGLYAEYLKRGEPFIESYNELLRATGSNNIADVAARMGIDVRTEDFWKSSLDIVAQNIETFLKIS
ncbi:M3 family oligoendopeptidase [Spirochaeta isovalerica]|uniref:PepF/M3 family oligoendopeptidase n=1 Tax=Spirochaeta isovalerica TaxID=150 RepID=A0A841RD88_9SPIO|nr:M3 family oligoendopeptidase [Spirochaeta isovalerica]MBB6481351.1 pepF/M3 family oligoendopeptidase [Spirochaeta isovalerica]